jgi:hypothetical protein
VATVTNINEVLDGHVTLEVDCVDRLYLNAYVAKLQVPGQVARFLHDHLGFPLPSPALFEKIGNRFRGAVRRFADDRDIPVLRLKKPDRTRRDDRKLDHVRHHISGAGDHRASEPLPAATFPPRGVEAHRVCRSPPCRPRSSRRREPVDDRDTRTTPGNRS